MASPAPAKSQPLHNFSLPLLKWSKNHSSSHHRGRRPSDSPPPPDSVLRNSPSSESTPARRPSPLLDSARRLDSAKRQSPMRDSASETESGYGSERRKKLAAESSRISPFVSPRDQAIERPPAIPEADVAAFRENRSPKIYIRLPKAAKPPPEVLQKPKSADLVPEESKPKSVDVVPEEPRKVVSDEGKKGPEAMEFDELEGKTWNLRPRKPLHKKTSKSGGGAGGGAPPQEAKSQAQQGAANRPEANSSRGGGGGVQPPAEKEKKPKFSVSLTKQEIEDDIFKMTGSKPNRRPKKRAKNVQKQLDNLYPGLWLVNVTPELYRVPENTPKAKNPK